MGLSNRVAAVLLAAAILTGAARPTDAASLIDNLETLLDAPQAIAAYIEADQDIPHAEPPSARLPLGIQATAWPTTYAQWIVEISADTRDACIRLVTDSRLGLFYRSATPAPQPGAPAATIDFADYDEAHSPVPAGIDACRAGPIRFALREPMPVW